jgi:hypothetical protein
MDDFPHPHLRNLRYLWFLLFLYLGSSIELLLPG